jgi:fumarylpyruvate hydrolase
MRVFDLEQTVVPVAGTGDEFPVRRIYCIGRNYAKHVAEMGHDVERSKPFFFAKPADAIVLSGAEVAYPPRTSNLHHEIELVAAMGKSGRDIAPADALEHVYGYAVGIDLTRRDLQAAAKDKGRPWETAKGFDQSAPISAIHRAEVVGHPEKGRIWLSVNGQIRQDAGLNELIWSVAESVAELSTLFEIRPGDLLYTGTPAGVGPLEAGDEVTGGIEGIDEIRITIR